MSDIGIALPGWAPVGESHDVRKLKEWLSRGLTSLATVFVNTGAAVITNRIIQAGTAPKFGAWGTGSTAAAVTDTDLQTEASETLSAGRISGTESRTTVTNTNDNYLVSYTITATGTKTIAETGLLDAQSSGATVPNAHGNLNIHGVFTGVGVNSADSIAFATGLKFVPN